jgi:hypothetical protein
MKKIVSIKQDERGFYIKAGVQMAGRAGIEISEKCPPQYVEIISEAYKRGWIIPVANMLESELMWDELGS